MRLTGFLLLVLLGCNQPASVWIAEAPAGDAYCHPELEGQAILPNGRIVKPAGKWIGTAPHPYGLVISPDNRYIVTANSGTNPLSITIIRDGLTDQPQVIQIPEGANTDRGVLASVFMGLAIDPDSKVVYVSGGQTNHIFLFDLATGQKLDSINCATSEATTDGYLGDLTLSADGHYLYVVDQIGFRMLVVDVQNRQVAGEIPVGRYPFGICLSADGQKAYVANVGMYQYNLLPGVDAENVDSTAWPFPAYEYLSDESIQGYYTEDSVWVPGLGDPNQMESFSVFTVDVSNPVTPEVIKKAKTGNLVGALIEDIPAVGGSSPNSLVATSDYVFVSNGNNDNLSVLSTFSDTVVQTIYLKPDPRMASFRGIIPFGLALSPDQKRLYVAESGINAVAVIDVATLQVLGHIPTAWFPAKLKVSADNQHLIIANAKGFGAGPNGGENFAQGPEGTYIGNLMKGNVQIVPIPDENTLKSMTNEVVTNNWTFTKSDDTKFSSRQDNPIPLFPGEKVSPIRHIVFISKENRTYDEIFGQVKSGNGDATIARYGAGVSFTNRDKEDTVRQTTVMPNHLQLARKYALADNFYVDSDHSADGHRWLVNTYPNEWTETCTSASYGGNRNFKSGSKAPGIFAMNGAAGAIYPEDYNEGGSMWDHLLRNEVPFYNFGFSIMFEPGIYSPDFKYQGIRHIINYPLPQGLYDRTCRDYPSYNMAIPDQFRVDQFAKEFNRMWIDGTDTMPSLVTVIIPNDHGAGERPEAGYAYRESYMSDNDLAVGRVVEFLSHTPYWKNMLIVIVEDDSQNGVDHIDAHRSGLLMISPYVKHAFVGHTHVSFGSIFKTFWNILGLPYLNQYDAGSTDLAHFFTANPDFTPYEALPVDPRVFDPQKALDPYDERFDWRAVKESPELDDIDDFLEEAKEDPAWRQQ
ncbi:MAG: hypothetical protein KDC57_07480 [Saprospiraceae bacterium]|nr:hypothetical protein [Saprospiraceae bacterium]